MTQATRLYGVAIPQQTPAVRAAVPADADSVALPAGVDPGEIVAVRNPAGQTVARFDDRLSGAVRLDGRGMAQAPRITAGAPPWYPEEAIVSATQRELSGDSCPPARSW